MGLTSVRRYLIMEVFWPHSGSAAIPTVRERASENQQERKTSRPKPPSSDMMMSNSKSGKLITFVLGEPRVSEFREGKFMTTAKKQ